MVPAEDAWLSSISGILPALQGIQSDKSGNERNISRVLVFKLGGKSNLPPLAAEAKLVIDPPPATADAATVASGEALYDRFCSVCHGEAAVAGGVVPDLRGSPFIAVDAWYSVVLDGALKEGGMAAFGSVLDRTQATAIRDYIIHSANEDDAARSARGRRQPDPSHGAVIAAQGTASGAPACAQCHAFSGGSDSSGAFPRIAGQPAFYLARQLRDFSSRVRANAIMSPIASALSSDDIDDVAAYYANVEAPFPPLASLDPALVRRGEELALAGNTTKGVPGCSVCHGAGGDGEPPTIPYLAGQYAHYTAFELQMWQRGFRRNSPEAMALFAKKLDDQEIAAVAAYYQQVRASAQATARPKR
jgi:cytochrome c553